ncbi:IS66 family insertion sequence element accessory protein TnpB [Agrobacterium vitis]|uniref:IS66 family insertion sequence element accessory protein TnpB n=1 Tax=Agrobacterium vitis TaxID=373 RepID=UPI00403E3BAC
MIVAGQRLPILIATRPVDFRCGHQALALMVQTELKLDPHSGVTVIFRSKRGDRLKILVWDGTGMVLIGVGARLSYQRSSFFDGSAYLAAPAEARQRTDFGRPQASIRLRSATPIAASVC